MATQHFSQSTNGLAIDTALVGTQITSTVSNGTYLIGSTINNTPSDGVTYSYDSGDLTLTLQTAVTTGTGAPNLIVWILPAVDGTNFPNPPGSTPGAAPLSLSYTFQQVPSASITTIICPNIPLPPYSFKVQVQFNLGAALAAMTTSTCKIQRRLTAVW